MTMENFNYKNYLKNNPLLKEDARTDAEEEGYKDGIKDEKKDMRRKSSKIKEGGPYNDPHSSDADIDFWKQNSEGKVKENGGYNDPHSSDADIDFWKQNSEGKVSEDARTDAEEEGYEDGFKDAKSDIKDKLSKMKVSELKTKIRERILSELDEVDASRFEKGNNPTDGPTLKDLDPKKVGQSIKHPTNEVEEEDVNVDIEDEENVDVNIEKDVEVDDESTESDIEVKTMVPGEDADVEAVQGLLTKAQQQAEKLGDDKLLSQIGNTITYFTRAHVVKVSESQKKTKELTENDDADTVEDKEDSAALIGKIPATVWAKLKADIKKPIDIARHMITFYKELVEGENFDPTANPVFNIAIGKLQDVAKGGEEDLSGKAIKAQDK